MSGLVDDRRVQELPLNGRNVVELASTLPGITDVSSVTKKWPARAAARR